MKNLPPSEGLNLYFETAMYLRGFINDLPYKSD